MVTGNILLSRLFIETKEFCDNHREIYFSVFITGKNLAIMLLNCLIKYWKTDTPEKAAVVSEAEEVLLR